MVVRPKICVITYPRPMASVVPLSNLMAIVSRLSSFAYLITGNEGKRVLKSNPSLKGISLVYKADRNFLKRILGHIVLQLRTTVEILRINKKIDIHMFFLGEGLILPLMVCGLTGKPVILNLAGSLPRMSENSRDLFSRLFVRMELLNYKMADKIIIYSPLLIKDWNLGKYEKKISIAHEHFLKAETFKVLKKMHERQTLVGYAGRLSEEKGILNFVRSMSQISRFADDICFVIAGDGELKSEIEKYLRDNDLGNRIKLLGWLSHEDLVSFFNELKLLVLPSSTEGLPNVALEAMACGTPVLATPVGAIPDYVRDGETGFLMEINSSECIAENVIRALNDPGIEQIADRGRKLIEEEFTFDKAVSKFEVIFGELVNKNRPL
jgi:glycosyltransferase involved in cell wall biosynthesis